MLHPVLDPGEAQVSSALRISSDSSRTLHPILEAGERRALFEEGIRRFNRREFFECHEAWEEIWRSTTPEPRDLFQGLIQIGVGFFHYFERERPDVARRVLAKGRRRLEPSAPVSHGLDLAALLAAVEIWEAWLEIESGEQPSVPKLELAD